MDYYNKQNTDTWDEGVYGTGNTIPPKNYSGIIALLLILVIFLSGIVSLLSFMNIKLLQQLAEQAKEMENKSPMSVTDHAVLQQSQDIAIQSAAPELQIQSYASGEPSLGITGEAITQFDQYYFHIPQGLYLTEVDPDSDAWHQGIAPGDILISLDGTPITTQSQLDTIVGAMTIGDTLEALFYRNGQEEVITLTVDEFGGK